MQKTIRSLLKEADQSYASARLLFYNNILADTALAAHRALRLYLHTLILSYGGKIAGKSLPQLGKTATYHSNGLAEKSVRQRLDYFEQYKTFTETESQKQPAENMGHFWFSHETNIEPLDELVAFIRPRIKGSEQMFRNSWLTAILDGKQNSDNLLAALCKDNRQIENINGKQQKQVEVAFSRGFNSPKGCCSSD